MTTCAVRRRALISLALALPLAAGAQDKPIEWVLGYAAGGGSDVVARTVAEQMARTLGRPIVVNNKPGAATNIAAEYVAKSKDVGHVVFTADFATLAANPSLFARLPYDPQKDFVPVGLLARFPLILVVPAASPAKTWKEFEAWARQSAEPVGYASPGLGSPHHLATFPEIPTLAEQGVAGFEAYAWQGLVAPAGTPPAQVAQFARALQEALASTPVKARFQTLSLEALPGTPEQMTAYVRAERERWGTLIKANNIRLD